MSFRRRRRRKSPFVIYVHGEFPTWPFFSSFPRPLWRHYVGRVRRLGAPFVRYVCRRHRRQKKRENQTKQKMHRQRQRGMKIAPRIRQLGNMQQQTLNNIHLSDITTAATTTTLVCLSDGKIKKWNPPLYSPRMLYPLFFRFEMTTRSCRADTWPTSAIFAMIMVNQFHEQTYNTGNINP